MTLEQPKESRFSEEMALFIRELRIMTSLIREEVTYAKEQRKTLNRIEQKVDLIFENTVGEEIL